MKHLCNPFLSLIGTLLAFASMAQQEYQFMNTVNNPYMLNPAAAGMQNIMNFELSSRIQWMGYNGGPRTMVASGHSPIAIGGERDVMEEYNPKRESMFALPDVSLGTKHTIGGRAMLESIGPFGRTSAYASYAYHMPFSKKMNFAAGIGLGWSHFAVRQDRVVLFHSEDASYDEFLSNSGSQNIVDANAGIVFYSDCFFFGASTTQILKNKVKIASILTESNFNRHFFLVSRYRFPINDEFQLEPGAVVKMAQNSPLSADMGARLLYNQSSWVGLQYRTGNTVNLQIGSTLINNIYLSYGYEISVGSNRGGGAGTHELQLGIYLGNTRNLNEELKSGSSEED